MKGRHAPLTPSAPMQSLHKRQTPLMPNEVAEAREQEAARQKWDSEYLTAAEAQSIPEDVLATRPDLQRRISYSQPDWPESRMSATIALGAAGLEGGEGQMTDHRAFDASDAFWAPPGDA